MAYVPLSGRIYVFGQGGSGQLGTGSVTNKTSPTMVKGPFVPCGVDKVNLGSIHFSQHDQPFVVVKRIYAGGDQTFVHATGAVHRIPSDDLRKNPLSEHIVQISECIVHDLSMIPAVARPPVDTIQWVISWTSFSPLEVPLLRHSVGLFPVK